MKRSRYAQNGTQGFENFKEDSLEAFLDKKIFEGNLNKTFLRFYWLKFQ